MNFQSLFIFVMFKMKYLIKKCNVTHYHNNCGGLMVGVFTSTLEVKGSNFTNGVFVVNNDKLIKYSPM
jgi:hypothetical protein